ncbi:hypothetical protein F4775DRAFT_535958 [Biscogniauxia sp. FL1348]|nr:hypothetical protein F4775DRAFT_535958 [Biscogniauxia sp. FL1348]
MAASWMRPPSAPPLRVWYTYLLFSELTSGTITTTAFTQRRQNIETLMEPGEAAEEVWAGEEFTVSDFSATVDTITYLGIIRIIHYERNAS